MKFPISAPLAAALPLLWAAAGCSEPAPAAEQTLPVTVASATVRAVPFEVRANGMVEPLESVAVQPQVAGPIVAVEFREGEEVRAGQVLFRIDPRPYQAALAQAEAALARDRVQAEHAEREAERYASLVEKGYVTQSQADQLRAAAAAQRAAVAGDEAAVLAARLDLGYATIRAPIAGRTGALLVKEGNVVGAPHPTPLVQINQLQNVLVRFTVPAGILGDLQSAMRGGSALAVRAVPTDLARRADAPAHQGTLSFMDNAVDTTTGTITLKARFPNESRALWPGQFLTVALDLYVQANALTVPSIAVQTGQEGSYVFVVDDEGRARMTAVEVSRTAGDLAIVSSGLEAGMRVVTDGQARLFPGAQVVIRDPATPAAAQVS